MKQVKVLFVVPNAVMQNPPPVAVALFNAILKKEGCEVRVFDPTVYANLERRTSDKTKEAHLQVKPFDFGERGITLKEGDVHEDIRTMVEDYRPDLIAMSCNEVTFRLGIELLESIAELKKRTGTPVIVGGVFATFAPELCLKYDFVDMACIGEGEEVLLDIVRCLAKGEDWRGIRNLAWKKDGKVVKNPVRPLVDINAYPLPDFSIFEENRFYRPMAGKVWRLLPIETNRGCPYKCTYCNSPYWTVKYREEAESRYFRNKTIERIDEELDNLVNVNGAEYIYILSDTFLAMPDPDFWKFVKIYEKYKKPFWMQTRPETITYEKMKALHDIGCHRMSIGVEHGNDEFRKDILKKAMSTETILAAVDAINRAGVPLTINNIIGFPGETRELAFDTIELNRRLTFDSANAYAFTPFHGTELHDVSVKNGYIAAEELPDCMTKGTMLNMPQFPPEEIEGLVKTFVLYVKLPKEFWPKIQRAEKNDEEGNRLFEELKAEYAQRNSLVENC